MNLNKPVEIKLLKEAISYFDECPEKIQIKFILAFDKTSIGLKGKWFKSIGDKIREFKLRDNEKFYRIFAFWDKSQNPNTLIVLTHGMNKKSNKTPSKEKSKAIKLLKLYFKNK